MIVLYLALSFAYFVPSRGNVALMAVNYGLPAILNNDVFAFVCAGVMPILLYELITTFVFRFIKVRSGCDTDGMRYSLRFFYIAAALVMGGVKLIFMFYPLAANFAFVLIDVLVPTAFFALYLWFALKHYANKTDYAQLIYELGGTFVIVYGVVALIELVTGVL